MPQPNKIPLAFASSGDKNTIPENTETTGLASWREGFPAITSAPFSEGGIAPKRADFNGIFYALSQAVMWLQQGGVYAYDVNTDYEAGNVVLDAGGLYVANAANGPSSVVVQPSSDTAGATWKLVRLDLATQSAAGYMSGADKTKLDGLISTDATPTAAGYMSAEDKTLVDSIPGLGTFNRMFFSQISGSYIAPRTGVYRITLKGGGGGGAGARRTAPRGGSGGGEGGTLIMYRTLIKAASYAYVIGAGGTGGINDETGSRGSAGGTTSITIDGTTYSAFGGGGADTPEGPSAPGAGGTASSVSDAIAIPGAPGQPGVYFATSGTALFAISGGGGGSGGGNATVDVETLAAGVMGGGGAGGAVYNGAVSGGANGGTGYILIEYAG